MVRPIAALLLVATLLCGGAEHVHAGGADGACTACQLERTTPVAPPLVVVPVEPPPVVHVAPVERVVTVVARGDVLSVAPKTSPPVV